MNEYDFIQFLKEYDQLYSYSKINIFHDKDFIWFDDIKQSINYGIGESKLETIFSQECEEIFSLSQPQKPDIDNTSQYLKGYTNIVAESKYGSHEISNSFLDTSKEKEIQEKLEQYKKFKDMYDLIYRKLSSSDDIIILSIGLIQLYFKDAKNKENKINKHLFHFPLKLSL